MKNRVDRKLRVALLGGMALALSLTACGHDRDSAPPAVTGAVVKAPVSGAKIFYDLNNNGQFDAGEPFATTDASGRYSLPGGYSAKLVSTGGVYVDPATSTVKAAPTLSAPAGSKNVSPLTDIVAKAGADADKVKANIEALGIKFDDALVTKTAENTLAMQLAESIGAVLSNPSITEAQTSAFVNAIVNTLKSTDTIALVTILSDPVANVIVNAVNTVAAADPDFSSATKEQIVSAIGNVEAAVMQIAVGGSLTTAPSNVNVGDVVTPVVPTGTTGGTGSGTGLNF